MKTLRKMKVINWHYFDEEEIAFGAATMLSGHSGAGKSTLLDALQYLFIGSQTQTRFNAAATQEARRTLLHYLRGKIKAEGVQYICVRTNSPPILHLSFMMTSRKTPSLSDMWSMSFMMTGCRRNSFSSISIRSRSLTFAIRTAHSIRRRYSIAGMRTAAVCLRRGRNNGRNA